MKVRLSRRAERDLAEIAEHVGAVNPLASASIGAALRAAQDMIALHPRIGRRQQAGDLRKLVVPRYGYLIYYRVLDDAGIVAILTIRHPSRARLNRDA